MTDFADLLKPDAGQDAHDLHLVDEKGLESWLKDQPGRVRAAVAAQGFEGEGNQLAILPGDGERWSAVLGVADPEELSPWCLAKAAESLPAGAYRVAGRGPGPAMLGWLLGQYRFDRYRKDGKDKKGARILLTDEPARIDMAVSEARATALVRDLVNIPAADMGPEELESAISDIARSASATLSQTSGSELERDYPLIHAVGAAATAKRAPRLVELEWGDPDHPRLALVGKGVVFDSGGLDIKSSTGMRLMKKDMGGAAHAIALARLVIENRLPVRLHLLVPAVENAISGASLRPGDVIKSRQGLTVEISNTDAEGRLILADALARAAEEKPDLVVDFATLTGAARVALGPELPPLYSRDDGLAQTLLECGEKVVDPLWRMPLWSDYEEMLSSDIADTANAAEGSMAGSVTAALFLAKFVPQGIPWAHLDIYAWRSEARPGRPKGGEAYGLRALWAALEARYSR
ncbi:MAG: M17 family metallopeptidase [Sphingomonadaceae bacterium]